MTQVFLANKMALAGDDQPTLKLPRKHREEFSFLRAELFHQMLMEDFDFLEAARWKSDHFEPPTFNYADVSSNIFYYAIPHATKIKIFYIYVKIISDKESFRKATLAYPHGLIEFDHFTYRSPSRVHLNQVQSSLNTYAIISAC